MMKMIKFSCDCGGDTFEVGSEGGRLLIICVECGEIYHPKIKLTKNGDEKKIAG